VLVQSNRFSREVRKTMSKMKSYFLSLGVLVMILNLCGCNNKTNEQISEANNFRDSIIEAISSKNVENLRKYFTDDISSSTNLDKGIEYIFNIFSGEIQSIIDYGTGIGGEFSNRGKSIIPTILCSIITDNNEYLLYFEYYQKDSIYQNKIIRMKLVIKEEYPDTGAFNNHGGMGNKTGIYYPGWDGNSE